MEVTKKFTPKLFLFKVLNDVALAIVVGLIPNAILGGLFLMLLLVVQNIKFTIPVITDVLIAIQFNLKSIQVVITGTAAFVGPGAEGFQENK